MAGKRMIVSPERPAVPETLGHEAIAEFLRRLRTYGELLDPVQADAMRFRALGKKISYLVDYQEVYCYMYQEDGFGSSTVLLEYLFDQQDVVFILGPGTMIELLRDISSTIGFDIHILQREIDALRFDNVYELANTSNITGRLRKIFEGDGRFSTLRRRYAVPLERLNYLLHRPNLRLWSWYSEKYGEESSDDRAFERSIAALNGMRPGSSYANVADAYNISAVVGLQQIAANDSDLEFPFLLTHTKPLLREDLYAADEFSLQWGYPNKVTRTPLSAVYSHVAFNIHPDPDLLYRHLLELSLSMANVEKTLRESIGYRQQQPSPVQAAWDELYSQNVLPRQLRSELDILNAFVNDQLIAETQEIYERYRLSAANQRALSGQQSDVRTHVDNQRNLFDTIVALSRILGEDGQFDRLIAQSWDDFIETETHVFEEYTTTQFFDHGSRAQSRRLYLNIEKHVDGGVSLAWPINVDAEEAVKISVDLYMSSDITNVNVFIGTDDGVDGFEAELPIEFGLIRGEMQETTIRWIRFESDAFDLVFDVTTSYHDNALVGLIANQPPTSLVVELYSRTSARFMFRDWLVMALQRAGLSG